MTQPGPGPWKKAVARVSLLKVPCLFGLLRCPVEAHTFEWVETQSPPGSREAGESSELDEFQDNEAEDDRS